MFPDEFDFKIHQYPKYKNIHAKITDNTCFITYEIEEHKSSLNISVKDAKSNIKNGYWKIINFNKNKRIIR